MDECAQMRFYRDEVVDFWREHPGEKARLAGQAARLLWQPNVLETEGTTRRGNVEGHGSQQSSSPGS